MIKNNVRKRNLTSLTYPKKSIKTHLQSPEIQILETTNLISFNTDGINRGNIFKMSEEKNHSL